MSTSPAVLDVSEATFGDEVLRRSETVPVVVDFWASWCGPCHALSPILERLASEADGAWVLAKIDVDANQSLAAAYGVRGIPAVKAFRKGRVADEFVGALPEQQVREWLRGLGPTPADLAVAEGVAAEARGDVDAALRAYRRALAEEPARADAKSALARLELERRVTAAEEASLRERLARDERDVEAATMLADVEFARGEVDAAVDRLIALIRASDSEARERARVHLLDLLDTLPVDDPRALRARRELAAALY